MNLDSQVLPVISGQNKKTVKMKQYNGSRGAPGCLSQVSYFGSGHDLTVQGFELCTGLCTDTADPAKHFLSLSLSVPLPAHSLSLSFKINLKPKQNRTMDSERAGEL